ncbi:uroporphyrinogen-III synthase [Planktotalea sp.]|uniref:uroporphyrinogen-III synthase n=1 Tax=Planktotalea sp. TaxID=2029877 RepID=UPI003D6C62BA
MTQPATLLLTRPREASERFARQVSDALGPTSIHISPLIEIEFVALRRIPKPQNVVFTSRNGIEAWKRANFPTDIQCFCVGQATAEDARALGFEPHISAGTVSHLIDDILKWAPVGEVLHVHGRYVRGDLVGKLREAGLSASGLQAYEQNLRALDDEANRLLQGGAQVIVPLFSPRSAAQFTRVGMFGPQIDVIAISQAAANECESARIAPSPDAKGMIAAISQGLIA